MLTARKKAFVDNYMLTRNASDSARKAGYSLKTCRQSGSRLLKDSDVYPLIEAFENQKHAELISKREERNKDLFVNTAWKEYENQQNPPPVRIKALEIAGRSLGHLDPASNAPAPVTQNVQININVVDPAELWAQARKLLE